MEVVSTSMERDPDLVRQYFTVRKNQMIAAGHQDYPDEISSDAGKYFLLAIENGQVLGGLRLNEVRHGNNIPVDKIEAARLENIFPNIPDVRNRINVLNVDGAFVKPGSDLSVIVSLINAVVDVGKGPAHDFVYFVPEKRLGTLLKRSLKQKDIEFVDFGDVHYENHDHEQKTKPMIGILINEELKKELRPIERRGWFH